MGWAVAVLLALSLVVAFAATQEQTAPPATDASYEEARAAKVPPGILVILLRATEDDTMPADARRLWIEKHKEWIATVQGAKHIVVEKTGHFIQAQQPKLVIDTIRQTLSQIR